MLSVILYSEQDLVVDEAFSYIEMINKWVTIGNHSPHSLKN